MKYLSILCFILLFHQISFAQTTGNKDNAIQCFSNFRNYLNKFKSDNYLIDGFYNKYYRNIENPSQIRHSGNVQVSWGTFFYNSPKTQSTVQVDENSGLIYLITNTDYDSRLKVFHPIIGPMQFIFDEQNGNLFLPAQTKKVRLGVQTSTNNSGYTLRVKKDGFTEFEDSWLDYVYNTEKQNPSSSNFPDGSNLNTFYVNRSVIDLEKTTTGSYKYYPSYQEKLRLYYMIGLPKVDLDNPNFYIVKTETNEVYKTEVWGRRGERHFLNDCFDNIKTSFSNYFIFKRDGKFGILNASISNWNQANPILVENIYNKITYIEGTEYFMAELNGTNKKINVYGATVE